MAVIFVFSAQDGEQSSISSGFVSDLLRRVLSPVMPDSALAFILKYIRKIAHVSIYFLLGLFTSLSAAELSRRIGKAGAFISVLITGIISFVKRKSKTPLYAENQRTK